LQKSFNLLPGWCGKKYDVIHCTTKQTEIEISFYNSKELIEALFKNNH